MTRGNDAQMLSYHNSASADVDGITHPARGSMPGERSGVGVDQHKEVAASGDLLFYSYPTLLLSN